MWGFEMDCSAISRTMAVTGIGSFSGWMLLAISRTVSDFRSSRKSENRRRIFLELEGNLGPRDWSIVMKGETRVVGMGRSFWKGVVSVLTLW